MYIFGWWKKYSIEFQGLQIERIFRAFRRFLCGSRKSLGNAEMFLADFRAKILWKMKKQECCFDTVKIHRAETVSSCQILVLSSFFMYEPKSTLLGEICTKNGRFMPTDFWQESKSVKSGLNRPNLTKIGKNLKASNFFNYTTFYVLLFLQITILRVDQKIFWDSENWKQISGLWN